MYSIYINDETCIYTDTFPFENMQVVNPKLKLEDNAAGSLVLTLPTTNVAYDTVTRLVTDISVQRDGEEIWEGRVFDEETDFYNNRTLTCEGALAFFNDTTQPPTEYHDMTVRGFLEALVAVHNAKVAENRQFTVGVVTVTDSNDSLYRYTNNESTLECINDKLVDRLGGHLQTRREDGVRYLDYLADYPTTTSQKIEFGKNLLDFTRTWDMSEFCTVLLPLGNRLDESEIEALDAYLTVESVNEGSMYVENSDAVAAYGWIEKVVNWDDVSTASALLTKAEEYLADIQFDNLTIELSAVDLHYLDSTVEDVKLLDQIRVVSVPHGLDRYFPVTKLEIPLAEPENTTYTLGDDIKTSLTEVNNSVNIDILDKISNIPTKSSILAEAKANATAIMNAAVTGYITIVQDKYGSETLYISEDRDYTASQRLWKWTLNGLGYSSDGGETYDIAITMDGAINGKMIAADSIYAASINVEYTTLIEGKISTAKTEANDYTNEVTGKISTTIEAIQLSMSEIYESSVHDYCVNGSFDDEDDPLSNWAIISTYADYISADTYDEKTCVTIANPSSGLAYISQTFSNPKEGTVTVRFKAACIEGDESKARIMCMVSGGSSAQLTTVGDITTDWTTFTFTFSNVSAGSHIVFLYSYIPSTTIYITDIEILGYYSYYNEAAITVNTDAITAEVTRATNAESVLSAVDTKYGTCSTAASTAAKDVTCTDFTSSSLVKGTTICVYFTYKNASNTTTLNVNSTGAIEIRAYGSALSSDSAYNWPAKSYVTFVYNGTYWVMADSGSSSKISMLADSITLSVTSNSGGTATIKLSVNGEDSDSTTLVTSARTAFAAESSSITISAGTITFASNTLVVDSTQFTLTSSGNATFSGTLSAASGSFSGTVTTSSGYYKAILSSGELSFYYNDVLKGSFAGSVWSGTSYTGIAMHLTSSNYFLSFSRDEDGDGTYIAAYLISYHSSISSYTHNFYGSEYHSGEVTFADAVTFDSSVTAKAYRTTDDYLRLIGPTYTVMLTSDAFFPYTSAMLNLGASGYLWKNIYATSSSITTSDRNEKHDINDISEKYVKLFKLLRPVTYMLNGGDRVHVGMIAQEVLEAMEQVGLTPEDFAGFCRDEKIGYSKYDTDGYPIESSKYTITDEAGNTEYRYALRYEEFISLCIYMIQYLLARVDTLTTADTG
ncbi:MAG: phage tail protein [Lachnospiraceae bacterium]|nr:phage tail protein [Lachnospiraceae bacterium]